MIPFPNFEPDSQGDDDDSTDHTNNVLPTNNFYSPVKALTDYTTTALAAECRGAVTGKHSDGTVNTFFGTATKLYKLNVSGKSFTDVSKGAGTYNDIGDTYWSFYQWGDTIVALSKGNPPQTIDISTASAFADLGGTPANTKYGTVLNEFAVHACVAGGTNQNKVYWSSIGDNTEWTAGTNLGGEQLFPEGGAVQNVRGGRVSGLVYQENSIRRMTFVGGDNVFRFDKIGDDIGLKAPYSLVTAFGSDFFYSDKGFSQITPDGTISPIGHNRVDEYFKKDHLESALEKMIGAVDPRGKRIYWIYTSNDAQTIYHDKCLIYNWGNDRWSRIDMDGSFIFNITYPAWTLEDLDTPYPSLDAMTISLDDPIFNAIVPSFGVLKGDNQLAIFGGSNVEATIFTDEFQPQEGGRAYVGGLTPLIDTTSATVAVYHKERAGDDWTEDTATSTEINGENSAHASGRYFKAKVVIPSGTTWSRARGIADPRFIPDGNQ